MPFMRKAVIVSVIGILAASIVLVLTIGPFSLFNERHVTYEYRTELQPVSSEQFTVVCPLPANETGIVFPGVLTFMLITGNATVSTVTTEYGEGLEVKGEGPTIIEWTYSFSYRSSTQSITDHYYSLSMMAADTVPENAYSHLEGSSVDIDLTYAYNHCFGTMGATILTYGMVGSLTSGWNTLPVDYTCMES